MLLFWSCIACVLYKPGSNVPNDANENEIRSKMPNSSRVSACGPESQKQM